MSIADVLEKLDGIEKKFDERFNQLEGKVNLITTRVDGLENRLNVVEEKSKKLSVLEKSYQAAIKKTKNTGVMAEYKSKELNVIFNNVPQDTLQEKMTDSLQKARAVLKDVLKIDDVVEITHAHRLPNGGSELRRPLIIKVASMFEKDKLWKNIKNVNAYNDGKLDTDKRYVELTHLPKKLFVDKMSLKDDFKKYKNNGKKPRWRLDSQNVEFCFVIGAIWYRPAARSDDDHKING